MFAHFARDVRQHLMLVIFQLHPKHRIRQRFEDFSHNLYSFFLRHILLARNFACTDKLQILTRVFAFAKQRWPLKLRPQTDVANTCRDGVFEPIRVRTSGPSSVIAMVCSEWALGLPSSVTTVHPSDNTFV